MKQDRKVAFQRFFPFFPHFRTMESEKLLFVPFPVVKIRKRWALKLQVKVLQVEAKKSWYESNKKEENILNRIKFYDLSV